LIAENANRIVTIELDLKSGNVLGKHSNGEQNLAARADPRF
jgi:hypothetical protein